ncbi:MAG: tetratricopeptide repeat protein [Candidatus Obscuribacterales bacterium]|nr:tetratricopeptide repeat protein [Candidatus Obscuribacterales bacterium]
MNKVGFGQTVSPFSKVKSLALAASVSCGLLTPFSSGQCFAAVTGSTKVDVTVDSAVNAPPSSFPASKKSVKVKSKSATGLEKKTLKLINCGKWKLAAQKLEAERAKSKLSASPGPESFDVRTAWLAFAYLFDNQTEKLDTLNKNLAADKLDDSPYALCSYAFGQASHGHSDEAGRTLLRLPANMNDDAFSNFALAAISGKQGKAEAAVTYLQRSCDIAPDFAWGYRTIGFLDQRWFKDLPKAESNYLKALAIEPDLTEARDAICEIRTARGDFDDAIEVAQVALKKHSKDATNDYRLAQIYIAQKRLKEAQAELTTAIKRAPGEAKYYRARASVRKLRMDYNGAILDQEKAVSLSSDKAFELAELASLNALAGNKNRAAANLQKALEIDPGNQAAHDRLVALLQEEDRKDDVIKEFQRLLNRQPQSAILHLQLGGVYLHYGQLDEAKKQFVLAQNLNPADPEPRRLMGRLYLSERNFGKAAVEFTAALNTSSATVSVPDLLSLGYCYWQNGDYMQAEAAYVTSLALQQLSTQTTGPDRLEVMRSLALLFLDEKRYSDAASQYESIVAMDKDPGQQLVDSYLLAQAKALKNLNAESAQEMLNAYDKLSDVQKQDQLFNVVDALLKTGQPELASRFLKDKQILAQVEKFDDQHKAVFYVEESNYYRLGHEDNKLQKAIDAATKVGSLKDVAVGQKSDAQLAIAQAYADEGDLVKASTAVQNANDVYGKNVAAYVLAAYLSLKTGDKDMAIIQAKKALALNPYDAKAYVMLGLAQEKSGFLKEATVSFRKAIELYPALLEAHRLLLGNLKALALTDEAQKEAEQIAQLEKHR